MRFLFKYATLSRPEWFKQTLQTWFNLLSGNHEYQFIISIDEDDKTMNCPEILEYLAHKIGVEVCVGPNKTKIEAINADMQGRDFDILVVVSDDMIPQVKGYDDIIARDMQQFFPDLGGALHYDDGCHGGSRTITLSVMGKRLYDRFGYIYHPSYITVFCDNEFTDVVRSLNKVVWLDRVIIRHEWRKHGKDELYARNDIDFNRDKANYFARKETNFNMEALNV